MAPSDEFYNLHDNTLGVPRELGPGINTRLFIGEQAMLSVVRMDPNAVGKLHNHDEEQWGVMLEGDGVRIQDGREFPVKAGDFWRTPSGTEHGIRAGAKGAVVLDIFSPPRKAYLTAGSGFGSG